MRADEDPHEAWANAAKRAAPPAPVETTSALIADPAMVAPIDAAALDTRLPVAAAVPASSRALENDDDADDGVNKTWLGWATGATDPSDL